MTIWFVIVQLLFLALLFKKNDEHPLLFLTKAQMQAHAAIFTRSAARVTREIGSRALEPMVAMGWQKVNSCTGHSMIHTLTFTGNVFFDLLFPHDALW